jgi:hypothetical protein
MNLSGGTQRKYEVPQRGQLLSQMRFEERTFYIRVKNVTAASTHSVLMYNPNIFVK